MVVSVVVSVVVVDVDAVDVDPDAAVAVDEADPDAVVGVVVDGDAPDPDRDVTADGAVVGPDPDDATDTGAVDVDPDVDADAVLFVADELPLVVVWHRAKPSSPLFDPEERTTFEQLTLLPSVGPAVAVADPKDCEDMVVVVVVEVIVAAEDDDSPRFLDLSMAAVPSPRRIRGLGADTDCVVGLVVSTRTHSPLSSEIVFSVVAPDCVVIVRRTRFRSTSCASLTE